MQCCRRCRRHCCNIARNSASAVVRAQAHGTIGCKDRFCGQRRDGEQTEAKGGGRKEQAACECVCTSPLSRMHQRRSSGFDSLF
eukprot:656343-Pleurochrysis_carterae.AAC.1